MLNQIDLSRLDLNLLVLFEAVLETRHIGRAAERLVLSPSAVSHSLGRLRHLLNDPLFLRTARGVVPTARTMELAEPIAEILAQVRRVVLTADPFDPLRSTRRFTIGATDSILAVVLASLLGTLQRAAPGVDISIRQILPQSLPGKSPWEPALADLETRALDIAITPFDETPARFASRVLYAEDFAIAVRAGHPFAEEPTLERYCAMRHVVVSHGRDDHGFVDEEVRKLGLSRRIAAAVPSFLLALAVVSETDMIAAMPRRFLSLHAERFDVTIVDAPLPLPDFRISAVTMKAALLDAGLAWLFDALVNPAPASGSAATS